jgi:hypothetical protein
MSGVSTFYPHVLVCSFAIVLSVSAQAEEVKRDDVTGMIIADGWEDTRNNCITCHSANQFLRQKGTRQTWTEILEWMKTQGFREVGDETEKKILDYLGVSAAPDSAASDAKKPLRVRHQQGTARERGQDR